MHIPVLLKEVLDFFDPKAGKKYIDATFGRGGHTEGLIEKGGQVLAIDRDIEVVRSVNFSSPKLRLIHGNFGDLEKIATDWDFLNADGVLFDLGIGSHQLDNPSRGFSFQRSGPLDMRYDVEEGITAKELVNDLSEKDLGNLFFKLGEERRFGRKIARAIVEKRKAKKIESTDELFDLIKIALPAKIRFRAADVARRIFQSFRLAVNLELENFERALPQALSVLKTGGRIAVISFHSLEDRIAKKFFVAGAKDCICPPSFPVCRCTARARLRILTKKPITPSETEITNNPRAHSAKLRVAEKLETKN